MTLSKSFKATFLFWSLVMPITIQASLEPVVQIIGNVSISVDAEGNNNTSGGNIDVNKPSGASVRSAYLMAASYSGRIIADGDVTLASTKISWDRNVFNNGGLSFPKYFHNVFADVTSIVKPIIDALNPGVNKLTVREINPDTIDGTILVVIFDDPNQTTNQSIILFFGGQDTLGDSFDIKLAESLDLTDPNIVADMGIGISFGFQGSSGTGMVSNIDVNGSRLTSSAGGEDDGGSFNGGLITVGGIGDSNTNPPPSAPSSSFDTDDELYNLLPFVSQGDTSIFIETINPSDDDNIFFGYLNTSVPAAILPNIPAPGVRTLVGNIDPNFPTIVLTHGLQEDTVEIQDLWTGSSNTQAAGLIRNALGTQSAQTNIVQYVWEDGFQKYDNILGVPDRKAYIDAQRNVLDSGTRLAQILLTSLGSNYDNSIHFIGHSLGTAVNAYATKAFLNKAVNVIDVQYTALDRPDHISGAGVSGTGILYLTQLEERIYGYDSNFFSNVLPVSSNSIDLRIDNYFAINGAGVGDDANGASVYNHPELIEPNDLDNPIFSDEGIDNNHSGVQQWYRWTINPNSFNGTTYCETDGTFNKPLFFDSTLNPCGNGWQWSLNAGDNLPPPNGDPTGMTTALTLPISKIQKFGCDVLIIQNITTITCKEQSSPFLVGQVDIPDDAEYLSFEYSFMNKGDGDYAVVLIDDIPIWVLSGSSVIQEGEFADSGPIPVSGFRGNHRITIALYGVGQKNAEFELRNLEVLTTVVNSDPVANAGINQTLECTGATGANVTLSGLASSDPDNDPLSYIWTGPFGTVTGGTVQTTLPLGTHTITLSVYDGNGGTDSDTVNVTVEDTIAPSINLTVTPETLWPPNHKMIQIIPTLIATDSCDTSPIVSLTTITSNEGDETNTYDPNIGSSQGDGNTTNDIEVNGENIYLRAERSGKGNGRVYLITHTAKDSSGNTNTATAQVLVPHNQ